MAANAAYGVGEHGENGLGTPHHRNAVDHQHHWLDHNDEEVGDAEAADDAGAGGAAVDDAARDAGVERAGASNIGACSRRALVASKAASWCPT